MCGILSSRQTLHIPNRRIWRNGGRRLPKRRKPNESSVRVLLSKLPKQDHRTRALILMVLAARTINGCSSRRRMISTISSSSINNRSSNSSKWATWPRRPCSTLICRLLLSAVKWTPGRQHWVWILRRILIFQTPTCKELEIQPCLSLVGIHRPEENLFRLNVSSCSNTCHFILCTPTGAQPYMQNGMQGQMSGGMYGGNFGGNGMGMNGMGGPGMNDGGNGGGSSSAQYGNGHGQMQS